MERLPRGMRVTAAAALALAVGLAPAAGAQPAGGWAGGGVAPRPGLAPDPIDQSRALSSRGAPTAGPPPTIQYRLVPEQRVHVPGTGREVVIPPYYERLLPDQSWQAPPVTGYGTRGEGPVYIPEPRQLAP